MRLARSGFSVIVASKDFAIFAPASAATGNLPAHFPVSCENSARRSVLPAVTPMTAAPCALNLSTACENAAASTLQPGVNAAGKKYTTTGPCFSAAARSKVNALPARKAGAVNCGACVPGFNAA